MELILLLCQYQSVNNEVDDTAYLEICGETSQSNHIGFSDDSDTGRNQSQSSAGFWLSLQPVMQIEEDSEQHPLMVKPDPKKNIFILMMKDIFQTRHE